MARTIGEGLFIGEHVAYWRKRRGKSQRALAGLAGISQPYLSQIERGDRPVERRATLVALAGALGVSVAELTGDPTDPAKAKAVASVPAIREAVIMRQAGMTREAPDHGTVDAAMSASAVTDGGVLGSLLPGLIGGCDGAAMVQVGYAAVFHLRYVDYGDLGREVARLALAEARELEDPTWIAVAEYVNASALPTETSGLAGDLCRQAAEAVSPHIGDPEARQAYGMLHLTAALRQATARRPADALAHLDEAADAAASLGEPDGTGLCSLCFGPTNVDMWRMTVLSELGDYELATSVAARVQPERIIMPHRQANFWIDKGRILASQRRDGEAVAAFLRAETISPQFVRVLPVVRNTIAVIAHRTRKNAISKQLRLAAAIVGLKLDR